MGEGMICRRPVTTYSIVARDGTGALGVGVQSHWFNVGAVVPWVEAGVGAVAVQSISDPSSGTKALDLVRSGVGAVAGSELLDGDEQAAYRQIAIVDADGVVATHTGDLCTAEAGHVVGDGFSVQANLMDRETVWPAIAEAFAHAEGDLSERLLTALEAAETEGRDVRRRYRQHSSWCRHCVMMARHSISGSRTHPIRSESCVARCRYSARTSS